MNNQTINVANVIEEGRLGGPQYRIMNVAFSIDPSIMTHIVMPKHKSKLFQIECQKKSLTYSVIPIVGITKKWKNILLYLILLPTEIYNLIVFFRKNKFDIIHVSGGAWQYKGVIAGRLAGCKVLWHLNDTHLPYFLRKVFQLLNPFVDGFIYSAERAKIYYSPFIGKSRLSFTIHPPVDTSYFDPRSSFFLDNHLECKWNNKIVIGTVANVNPIKGIELIIDAAKILKNQAAQIEFIVVGPIYESQKKYHQKLVERCNALSVENVHFLDGFSDVRPLLQRFDVYVCSSLSETGPMSLFEAMSMEKAVISTNVGDVCSLISNGDNGFVIDVDDSVELSKKIEVLIDNPAVRTSFGEKARSTVVSCLDIKICAAKHHKAYTQVHSIN